MQIGWISTRLNPSQSELIQFFESEWIRTDFSILMNLSSELFELRVQVKSIWSRIHSDWIGLIFNWFASNEIKNFMQINSGWVRIQILKWNGINLFQNKFQSKTFTRDSINFYCARFARASSQILPIKIIIILQKYQISL